MRGADIVGTPLASFAKILATSDKLEVFNGYCGAESGSVPVSAVSPAILVSEIEIQKKESSRDRPPLLPPPHVDGGRKVKRRDFLVLSIALPAVVPGASAQRTATGEDMILRAMRDELQRSMQLRIMQGSTPYYIEYALEDLESFSANATLGALVASGENRLRFPRVQVRVGDYEFDNTNYIFSDFFSAGRIGSVRVAAGRRLCRASAAISGSPPIACTKARWKPSPASAPRSRASHSRKSSTISPRPSR